MAVLALTVAACGDDSDSGDDAEDPPAAEDTPAEETAPEEPEEVSLEDAHAEYTSCMEGNGADTADIPEGTGLEELAEMVDASPEVLAEMGVDAALVESHAACWPIVADAIAAGAVVPEDTSPTTVDQELAGKMHAAVACLNDRGWDFLEPGVEAGPLEMAPRATGFNWDDPTFLQDQRECQQQAGMMVP